MSLPRVGSGRAMVMEDQRIMKLRIHHLLGAAVLLGISGLVHGMWTNRWQPGIEMSGKDLLTPLEEPIGDWQPDTMITLKASEIPAKTKAVSRRFTPLKSGRPLVVSVSSGHPGVITAHTPDVCYPGSGFVQKTPISQDIIKLSNGKEASFWMADFEKQTPLGNDVIRVRWSWCKDKEQEWKAPERPRLAYARTPLLYKVYMVHPVGDETDLTKDEVYRKFAGDLLPALSRQLVQ